MALVSFNQELVVAAAVEIGYSRADLAWQMTCIPCQLLHKRVQHSPVARLDYLTESFSWHISVGFLNYWFCKPENFGYNSQQSIAFSLQNSTSIKVCSLLDFPCWQGNTPLPLRWILFCFSHYKKKVIWLFQSVAPVWDFSQAAKSLPGKSFFVTTLDTSAKKVSTAVITVNQETGFGNLTGLLTSQLNV